MIAKKPAGVRSLLDTNLQAAIVSGCQPMLSEDLQHGATFSDVRIVNPLFGVVIYARDPFATSTGI